MDLACSIIYTHLIQYNSVIASLASKDIYLGFDAMHKHFVNEKDDARKEKNIIKYHQM